MAEAKYCDGAPVRNPLSTASTVHPLHPDIVIAPAITPELQVKVLALVDETDGISLGDCMAALPGAVDAVLAMVEHGLLAVDTSAPFDQHLQIRRVSKTADGEECAAIEAQPGHAGLPGGEPSPFELALRTLEPQIFAVPGDERRQIAKIAALAQPGIYFLVWYDSARPRAYVGYGKSVAGRLLAGEHATRPSVPDLIIGIVEKHDQLSAAEARVLERLAYQALDHSRDVDLLKDNVPDGDVTDPASYALLRQFLTQVIFGLRENGLLCLGSTARHHAAGPRAGRGQLAPLRVGGPPEGRLLELSAVGIKAYAAEQAGCWTVLSGSQVRRKAVPSANSPTSLLRAEYLYSGILVEDGACLRLTRDLAFDSGSGAAQFVTGGKGHGLAAWQEVDEIPDVVLAPFAGRRLGPAR